MEGFFYQCRAVRQTAELREFIYRTYQGAAVQILSMDWREATEVIKEGREQDQRRRYWQMYCNMYPFMTEDTFVQFDEWYEGLKAKTQKSGQTVEEIMSGVSDIINMTLGGKDGFTV